MTLHDGLGPILLAERYGADQAWMGWEATPGPDLLSQVEQLRHAATLTQEAAGGEQ